MAYNKNQSESPIPLGADAERKSVDLLPKYFRTDANQKILSSTLDQMLQPGVAEKVEGYFGRTTAKSYRPSDTYVEDVSEQRQTRQLEPATVVTDNLGNVLFHKDYTDYVNQIKNFNGNVLNQSLLNSQEFYAWNPNIDWDKFVNFREYYWLPYGPQTVNVYGENEKVESTLTVSNEDQDGVSVYLFNKGFTPNPELNLFRGQTYRFEINTPGHPFSFSTNLNFADTPFELIKGDDGNLWRLTTIGGGENESSIYIENITATDLDGNEIPPANVEQGIIEFTVPFNAPDRLYYASQNSINTSGFITIDDIEENTKININDILGKKAYKSANGVEFTNGLKVEFIGTVTPEKYATDAWYVDGVGDEIVLIREDDLTIPAAYVADVEVAFDSEAFDRMPYENANSFAGTKDYIVINRSSVDRNAWSRYNRWFHRDVIEKSASYNGQAAIVDQSARAIRPIIEFEAGLKLYNFGTQAKNDVDLIDVITKDVFSDIEGSTGYNIDGVDVADGMRILFTADTDILVTGKIYKVNFIQVQDRGRIISLVEETDTSPLENETVLITNGQTYRGTSWFYNGSEWKKSQLKSKVNQAPLFDLFDDTSVSLADTTKYPATSFLGNKVFSYIENDTGEVDSELGFGITYKNIENIGDILFDFTLIKETYTYQQNAFNTLESIKSNSVYLHKFKSRDNFSTQSGWTKAAKKSQQAVIRQYVVGTQTNNFAVDVFDNSGLLQDLKVKVFLNNILQKEELHYTIDKINNISYIRFLNTLAEDDVIQLKCFSTAVANDNGYYELAHNLERNPLNNDMQNFTLGEVIDHVGTIVENVRDYDGSVYPGTSNLRDLGELDEFGTRFVKHSGPINLPLYHITDKSANIIKAVKYARLEYAKFKRLFLQTANTIGYDGPTKQFVDRIFEVINSEKNDGMPFYFTDMIPVSGSRRIEHPVQASDTQYYALSEIFDLNELSQKAVLVYLNGTQLTYGKDYTFNSEGFINVTATKTAGDLIEIYEYESTDGCYVPATPTKLGLYPKYEPKIFIDDTYVVPVKMIQGHDGSLIRAFEDYRDDLILELELRIYNNIKQEYRTDILDIHDFLGGEYRNTGFTKDNIDKSQTADFIEYVTLAGNPDYTSADQYIEGNSFTYNYKNMSSPSGKPLPGWWRQVYIQAYDTDRPHTHPWEMLGFTIKPLWWEAEYGTVPYTRNNFVLWEDLEKGLIKAPTGTFTNSKYARPGLTKHIPVDENGNLSSPLESNYAQNYVAGGNNSFYEYGDGHPVESAWRKSAEYPFSVMLSWILNQPAHVIGIGFDISRIKRDPQGNLVSTVTNNALRIEDVVFPNTTKDDERLSTSGLINFVYNYLASNTTASYETYQNTLKNITNRLSLKVGGFTEKEKFKLILDSRTPLNEGNVFVPIENYKVFLNSSSPVETVSYSGVIIEKKSNGYVVRGYDRERSIFEYHEAIQKSNDPSINIGGISESFVEWDERKQYIKAQNVRLSGAFYRCKESHISTTEFDNDKFQRVAALPLIGGKTAIIRKNFTNRTKTLPYGSLLKTVQDVVDFLLGYQSKLQQTGFAFDYFDENTKQVCNWDLSVKEFLFWSTQNWAENSLISLSPAANEISFSKDYHVVDNIFDPFYDYSLFKSDGTRLERPFTNVIRDNKNTFGIRPKTTEDGVYHVQLPLIQREHAIVLDNETVFGDVIYDQEAGYRQERIRVTGYRSDNWTGGLNIPGFVYDEAIVEDWIAYKDYPIGSLVKYKEYYYVSTLDLTGVEKFNDNDWERLEERPEAKMYPNFDYRINQFADFYDLDSDNFDVEQQKHAQHLIGYQKRQYLQNIINDDVSQYKFYQGMIQDKGTINSLDKLFDALSSADKDSIEFYEEWAIRSGQYGATDNFQEVEFIIDEDKIVIDPTPVELVNSIPGNDTDDILKIIPNDVYYRPKDYNHKPFPVTTTPNKGLKSAGYVNENDIVYKVKTKDDLLVSLPGSISQSDYIWVTGTTGDWDVLQHVTTDFRVLKIEGFASTIDAIDRASTPGVRITFNKTVNLVIGDIIGLQEIGAGADGFYLVINVTNNVVECLVPDSVTIDDTPDDVQLNGYMSKLRSVRAASFAQANNILEEFKLTDQYIWLDGTAETDWAVLKKKEIFTDYSEIINPVLFDTEENFTSSIASNAGNTIVAIGDNKTEDGAVHVYQRASSANDLKIVETLRPETRAVFTQAITNANPGVVTASSHGLTSGDALRFKEIKGITELNNVKVFANVIDVNTFSIYSDVGLTTPINTTSYGVYEEGLINTAGGFGMHSEFGSDTAISPDGKLMVVGAPSARNIVDNIKGDFNPSGPIDEVDREYKQGNIVKYKENFWKAVRSVPAENNSVTFSTFDSYAFFEETLDPVAESSYITFPLKDDGVVVDMLGQFTLNEIVTGSVNGFTGIVTEIDTILNNSGNRVGESIRVGLLTGEFVQGEQITGFSSGATASIDTITSEDAVNLNSRQLTLILQGSPYLSNTPTDHILIRAPRDQYRATKPQDKVVLGWNGYTGYNRSTDQYTFTDVFPGNISLANTNTPDASNKTYVSPRSTFINGEHEILHKVDHVLFISNPALLPEEGSLVDCPTGAGTVVKVFSKLDRSVIYINNVNGVFPTDSILSFENVVIGDYTQPNHTPNDSLGGFWYIAAEADGYYNSNEFTYLSNFGTPAYGLVYKDVLVYDENTDSYTSSDRYYSNILNNVASYSNKEVGHIQILSHLGDAYDNVSGVRSIKDTRWFVRAPSTATYNIGDEFRLFLNTEINDIDLLDGNNGDQVVSRLVNTSSSTSPHVVHDVWDGYIDILMTAKQTADIDVPSDADSAIGDYFEPSVGDFIEDGITGARAQVVHYIKRNVADVRVFVKNITVTNTGFRNKNDVKVDFTPHGDAKRPMGQIQKVSIADTNHDNLLGKLIVVAEGASLRFYDQIDNPSGFTPEDYFNTNPGIFTFDPHPDSYGSTANTKDLNNFGYINKEYWLYTEKLDEVGANLPASFPASTNRDWTLANNIPTTLTGQSGFYTNTGLFFVYEKLNSSWQFRGSYTVPLTTDNVNYTPGSLATIENLGKQIEISQDNNLYRIFVASKDKVFLIKHGVDSNGEQFEFALDIDNLYRGEFDITLPYAKDEIVRQGITLYRALTFNFGSALTNTNKWELVEEDIQNNYYLPKTVANNIYSDDMFDTTGLVDFSQDMSVSSNGQVVALSVVTAIDADADNKVAIYRLNTDGRYVWSQTLIAPNSQTQWGSSIDLTPDGNTLVVGDPGNDDLGYNTGKVFIYERIGTNFVLVETLKGAETNLSRRFGNKVSATNTHIAISSYNGDIILDTTFDKDNNINTIWDRGFTKFVNVATDSGSVAIYEKTSGGYIYAEELEYDNVSDSRFAENLLLNRNHIYVGCPRINNESGNGGRLINYNTEKDITAWTTIRSSNPIVDTNKIRQVYLYDKTVDKIVQSLDYVDIQQGKIPGPAEQELTFKSYVDLAKFNVTSDSRLFSETDNWESNYVGKLWWDISTARFKNHYQGNSNEQTELWHSLISTYNVDVYEWVESNLLPSEWDAQADTPNGFAKGISGKTKYGDETYSQKLTYDKVSKTFGTKYYYWVKDKFTIPAIDDRTKSAGEVANLIRDPKGQGYRFVALLSNDRFVLYNCQGLIKDKDIVLHVDYYTLDNQEQNIHTQYQIISQGLDTSEPGEDIAQKWIDSLVGYDVQGRHVPDYNLTAREKYGINFQPRQTWFINRHEALKQVIERANSVLKKNIIVDDFSFSRLTSQEVAPSTYTREYDVVIDSFDDLQFVGTAKARPAQIDLIIDNGTVTRARIIDRGRSYKDINGTLLGPTYNIIGNGTGLELATTINKIDGSISTVEVLSGGTNYEEDTQIVFRRLRVLVRNDSTTDGRWSIYEWDEINSEWNRVKVQSYNTNNYWKYTNWYADGFNQFSTINHLVDQSYQLESVNDRIGDIVKISNIGSGGWLLLQKTANTGSRNYTDDYTTIGRENGTIEILDSVYNVVSNNVGFDSFIYDGKFYDNEPTLELRNILDALRYDIFVDNLKTEYNELFFSSIRYVLSEQPNVDWVFKTSFVKAKHNVGQLREDITFKNDNLPSYNDYIEEVKPYKTNVREYLSAYERTDNTNTLVTDFDVPPIFEDGKIQGTNLIVRDNQFLGSEGRFNTYPDKNWFDNAGYKITNIDIYNGGSGYTYPPIVKIEGGGGTGATAQAFIGKGKVVKIEITNPGNGYTSAPKIILDGSVRNEGVVATASAILGETLTKTINVSMKFDRTTKTFVYNVLPETETFIGTGAKLVFDLKYPMDLRATKVVVTVDGEKQLKSKYTYQNVVDKTKSYTRHLGRIVFDTPPAIDSSIVVEYSKDISMLNAADRVTSFYNPTSGMLGEELAQVIDGVDYGGVEVRSFDFDTDSGWDTDAWYDKPWDTYDNTFEDHVFYADGTTTMIELDTPLEDGVVYNLYKNGVRLDDADYPANPTNPNAVMTSITGDGSQILINLATLGIQVNDGDVVVIRKITSEGILNPDPDSYDTLLTGGQLNYGNAQGVNADDIVVDGDLFVTPTTSGGPEELISGQVLDTVDIKVFERVGSGANEIYSQNFVTDGIRTEYDLKLLINSTDAVVVKLDKSIVDPSTYVVDTKAKTITFNSAPTSGKLMTILSLGKIGQNILDIDTFIADGSTTIFETSVKWQDDIQVFTTINGKTHASEAVLARESANGRVEFEFTNELSPGDTLEYELYSSKDKINYSKVDRSTLIADGSSVTYTLPVTPVYNKPEGFYTIVEVAGNILSPGYAIEFIIEDKLVREYQFERFQVPNSTLQPNFLNVFLNNVKLEQGTQYLVNIGNSSITLDPGIVEVGDKLELFTMHDADYQIEGNVLTFKDDYGVPAQDAEMNIYTFANHDVQGFQRYSYTAVNRSTLTVGSKEHSMFHNLMGGKIQLASPAFAEQYVWTVVNGELLQPNVDYKLSIDKTVVILNNQLEVNDTVNILHFAAPVSTSKIAWRQFQDILNRNVYKRIDNGLNIKLAKDLNNDDLRVSVVDASELPDPDRRNNIPGVIFIDGERIEYLVKDGNLLRQLRRGTMGTGIKDFYAVGTKVQPAGREKNIPYRDNTHVQNFVATQDQTDFVLDFTPVDPSGPGTAIDTFEVFAAGKRLRKTELQKFVIGTELDSPEGDVTLAQEFALNGNTLVLTSPMPAGKKVTVIRKTGQLWGPQGTPIKDLQNDIGNFLRGSISELPE